MIISTPNRQRISIALMCLLLCVAHARSAQAQFTLSSSSLAPGTPIGQDFACTGADRSPALAWSGVPQTTKSFALVVDDPDAPGGTFIHWLAFNIPAHLTSLAAGVPQTAKIPEGGINSINSFGHYGYNGPCPPPGKVHHYRFRLFALDSTIPAVDKANADAIQSAMKDHVLATAELDGTFER
jgi:Raf kinase inhibitor-like YbhB/YbcL family protein